MTDNERGKRYVVDLDVSQERALENIRQYYGLKNYAEVLRFLVSQEDRTIRDKFPLFSAAQPQECPQ